MFGRATITLGTGPHSSYIYYIILCPYIVMHAKRVCTQCLVNAFSSTLSSKFSDKAAIKCPTAPQIWNICVQYSQCPRDKWSYSKQLLENIHPVMLVLFCLQTKTQFSVTTPSKKHRMTMAATFWLLTGYNFGCMIASDMPFDTRGGFSGPSYPMKT